MRLENDLQRRSLEKVKSILIAASKARIDFLEQQIKGLVAIPRKWSNTNGSRRIIDPSGLTSAPAANQQEALNRKIPRLPSLRKRTQEVFKMDRSAYRIAGPHQELERPRPRADVFAVTRASAWNGLFRGEDLAPAPFYRARAARASPGIERSTSPGTVISTAPTARKECRPGWQPSGSGDAEHPGGAVADQAVESPAPSARCRATHRDTRRGRSTMAETPRRRGTLAHGGCRGHPARSR